MQGGGGEKGREEEEVEEEEGEEEDGKGRGSGVTGGWLHGCVFSALNLHTPLFSSLFCLIQLSE